MQTFKETPSDLSSFEIQERLVEEEKTIIVGTDERACSPMLK